jgi:hypothetical protein
VIFVVVSCNKFIVRNYYLLERTDRMVFQLNFANLILQTIIYDFFAKVLYFYHLIHHISIICNFLSTIVHISRDCKNMSSFFVTYITFIDLLSMIYVISDDNI